MTKLFAAPFGFTLADDPDDVREICMAAGRIQHTCDLPEELLQDVTDKALAEHDNGSLAKLIAANLRGLVYPDPKGWQVLPLSIDCTWLHDNATELEECPACKAPAGFPCESTEEHPIYEGTAHRRRVRLCILNSPAVLDHSLLK